MTASKDTLREQARKHRDMIDPGSEDSDEIIPLFYDKIGPEADQVIALYWPKGREFDPRGLLLDLLRKGYTCALPVMTDKEERVLEFARWTESTPLVDAHYGLKQPHISDQNAFVRPSIVCVPFLAFDRRGYRLGYGGGHYDATITALRENGKPLQAIGLGYAQQGVIFNLPTEDHDVPLDWIITPRGAFQYK